MEWERDLRRSQSLKSLTSPSDKEIWTDAGLQNRATSVSQLVTRYQTTVKRSTFNQAVPEDNIEGKTKVLNEMTPSPLQRREIHLDSLLKRNEERERTRSKVSVTRSKSVGSIQNSTGSIQALKGVFESKAMTNIKPRSSFKTGNVALRYAADMSMMNGEAEDVQKAAEEQIKLADKKAKNERKDDVQTQKVVNQTHTEKRKIIAGNDFAKVAASEADEKRRSAADIRDSSFIETKEILSVSVKAMSALYMSKVANQVSANSPSKEGKDQSQPQDSGKKAKLATMNEEYEQRKDDLSLQPPEDYQKSLEDIPEGQSQQLVSYQLSREMLFQQRQKSELRRLLKHTCPEIKMLDDVLDEEFAEVLSSEIEHGGETGYEGDVLSRCLIFENCGHSKKQTKINMAEGAEENQDYRKNSSVFEELKDETYFMCSEGIIKGENPCDLMLDFNKGVDEETEKVNVTATRKVFENQSSSKYKPDEILGDSPVVLNKEKTIKRTIKLSETFSAGSMQGNNKSRNEDSKEKAQCVNDVGKSTRNCISSNEISPSTDLPQEGTSISVPDLNVKSEMIAKNAALFQNNPFISTNIEKENSYSQASKTLNQSSATGQGYPTANVRNRTHLFESIPFDKIRHHNQDELETLVQNIKDTLNALYHVKAIHSDGAIIEVNETMIAKKSKFTILDRGPEIKYDTVAEGGAQNFIVQLLPQVNLKPLITYLKENSKGCMDATFLDALAHQHQFSSNKDDELKTANVVQLVEDILNQDNSLIKGVIIQGDARKFSEIIVYSLYKYVDDKDVKSYSPPKKSEHNEPEANGESISKNSQNQFWSESIRSNVKLVKSCIERGDLDYLRSLHDDALTICKCENQAAIRQDYESYHQIRDPAQDGIQVELKRLKENFPEEKGPCPSNYFKSSAQSSKKSQSSIDCDTGVFLFPQCKNSFNACFEQEPKGIVDQTLFRFNQTEITEVVDGTNEVSEAKTAFQNLCQAENETKIVGSGQEIHAGELFEIPIDSVTADIVTLSGVKAESSQEISNTNMEMCLEKCKKPSLVQEMIVEAELDCQQKNTEMTYEDSNSEKVKAAKKCIKIADRLVQKENLQFPIVLHVASSSEANPEPEEEKVFCQGTIQAALDSLEKFNINVTRGDISAAMIYSHSNKFSNKTSPSDVQKNGTTDICFLDESKSKQQQQELTVKKTKSPHPTEETKKQQVTVANTGSPKPTEESKNLQVVNTEALNSPTQCVISMKNKRIIGPKPQIPPKPEHLKEKQIVNTPSPASHPKGHRIITQGKEETICQVTHPSATTLVLSQEDTTIKSVEHHGNDHLDEATNLKPIKGQSEVQSLTALLQSNGNDIKNINGPNVESMGKEEISQKTSGNDIISETDETHINFQEARQKFGNQVLSSKKMAPVKPKRVKHLMSNNKTQKQMSGIFEDGASQIKTDPSSKNPKMTADGADSPDKDTNQSIKLEMREKKVRIETEDECRQRLSIQMYEIVSGNVTAAMEIFKHLRKQEQLQTILSRVQEIENDTSEVDVRFLRTVFENVPDWIVNINKKEQKKVKAENESKPMQSPADVTKSKSSMENIYGDLERASEEIIHLKEQTLARLKDIEDTIRKALFSVSSLKSDSEITSLSNLLKESLGAMQGETTWSEPSPSTDLSSTKQEQSPPSSPPFISSQSPVRNTVETEAVSKETSICIKCQLNQRPQERFRTLKTGTCNSPAQSNKIDPRKGGPKQTSDRQHNKEVCVLHVQTDSEGNSMTGMTVENLERTDSSDNLSYTSKTSTLVLTQPQKITSQGANQRPSSQ